MDPESLARWSAWPAAGCYSAAVALSLLPTTSRRAIWRDRLWLCGWVCLALHILISLGLVHGWSWSAAYEHTAQRTQQAVGWSWGGGVWFNLVALLVWGLDMVIDRGLSHDQPAWKRRWDVCCQFYLAFMFFNAAVVFGSWPARIAGLVVCGVLAWLAITSSRRESRTID